jgi:hypothetical protein
MGSGNDSVTVGGGDNDVALGAGNDSVTMGLDSVGSDTFVLTGSDASLALHGSNNAVFIYGGADAITDSPFGADALTLHLGATGGIASVSNFSPAMGVIDLAPQLVDGGVLGAAPTAQDVATYMNGNGGLLLFANNAGALVLSGAAGNLSANNFHIG